MIGAAAASSSSSFEVISGFLIRRYELSETPKQPPLEILVDGSIIVELHSFRGRLYLLGEVVEAVLVNGEKEAQALLEAAGGRMGQRAGTLAWDVEKKRIILWKEVTQMLNEREFNENLDRFLTCLEEWIGLVPESRGTALPMTRRL